MRYVRRIDNPLKVLAWAHTIDPGCVTAFDPLVYEEVEGELPDGYELEPKPTPKKDQIKAVFAALPIEVKVQFATAAAAVYLYLDNQDPEAAAAVIQATPVPDELTSVKTQLLSILQS